MDAEELFLDFFELKKYFLKRSLDLKHTHLISKVEDLVLFNWRFKSRRPRIVSGMVEETVYSITL